MCSVFESYSEARGLSDLGDYQGRIFEELLNSFVCNAVEIRPEARPTFSKKRHWFGWIWKKWKMSRGVSLMERAMGIEPRPKLGSLL